MRRIFASGFSGQVLSYRSGSCAPSTFFGHLGLVDSQLLGESRLQWSSADIATLPCHARSLTQVNDQCPEYLKCGFSSSVIRCPTPGGILSAECDDVQESRGAGPRICASSKPTRWQRGVRRVQRAKRSNAAAELRTGGFWMSTPLFANADRSFDVSKWRAGRVAPGAKSCGNPRCTTDLSTPRLDIPQGCDGACAPSGQRRRNRQRPGRVLKQLLCPRNSASPWFTAS